MKDTRSLLLLALVSSINAQSAPGFPIQVNSELDTRFEDTTTHIDPAGMLVDRSGK
jgi:hypothetical protein